MSKVQFEAGSFDGFNDLLPSFFEKANGSITVSFSSMDELRGFCTKFSLTEGSTAKKTTKKVADDEEEKPAKKSKKVEADDEEEKPAKKSKKVEADDEEEKPVKKVKKAEEEGSEIEYKDIREMLMKLDGTDEEDSIPGILEKFDVEKASALTKKDWPEAFRLLEKAYKRSSPLSGKD